MTSTRLLLALLAAAAVAACDGRSPEEPEDSTGPPGSTQPGFRVTLASPRIEVRRGTQVVLPLTVSRWGGFSGTVAVSPRSAPDGVAVQATVIPQGADSSALRISAGAAADTGLTKLTLITTAISLLDSVYLELRVTPAAVASER